MDVGVGVLIVFMNSGGWAASRGTSMFGVGRSEDAPLRRRASPSQEFMRTDTRRRIPPSAQTLVLSDWFIR